MSVFVEKPVFIRFSIAINMLNLLAKVQPF